MEVLQARAALVGPAVRQAVTALMELRARLQLPLWVLRHCSSLSPVTAAMVAMAVTVASAVLAASVVQRATAERPWPSQGWAIPSGTRAR